MQGVKEFTMECNPDDITSELCEKMVAAGVNRVSMGVQTFSDDRLRFLHRRHNAGHIHKAIEALRHVGIKNISMDLMFGFPGESIEEWENDIKQAIETNVQHISAYSLMYEEGTPLYRMCRQGIIKENEEERSVEMYEVLRERLSAAQYEQYEISNFAQAGYKSIHNSNYWNGTPYIGLGAAAHSYDKHSRQWNVSNLKEYVMAIEKGVIPMEREIIDSRTRYNDMITTALRTCEGIDLSALTKTEYDYIIRSAQKSINTGLLAIDNNKMRLTDKGFFVSDDVMSDLIQVD